MTSPDQLREHGDGERRGVGAVDGGATDPRAVLVTIHGTAAGDTTAAGDRWWQLGSHFLEELGRRIDLDPERVEIVPFQWGEGANLESERRKAGDRLLAQLRANESEGRDIYLLGHSHGGSVAYTALLKSIAARAPLDRLRCWCTVGTPFLDYRANTFLFQRLKSIGLTFYATGLAALVLGPLILLNLGAAAEQDARLLAAIGWALALYGALSLAGLFVNERRRHKSWYTLKQKRAAAEAYGPRWLGLWHPEDEAISALANIKRASAPIISDRLLEPFVYIAQLAVVIVPALFLAYDALWNGGAAVAGYARELLVEEVDPGEALDALVVGVVAGLFYWAALLLLVLWIATLLMQVLALLLGKPLSWSLNRLVWSSMRRRAWGDDLTKEDVREIAARPPELAADLGPLPEEVAVPLSEHSERHAIVTLQKVRRVLGMTQDSEAAPDLRAELSESLQWNELIHTSYFDVPEFVDLLALGLHRAGLGELREEFTLTAERERLLEWCRREPESPAETPA